MKETYESRTRCRAVKNNRLGRTGVTVTTLGFGAAPLGNLYRPLAEHDALAAVNAAWASGVRYFDTAPHY